MTTKSLNSFESDRIHLLSVEHNLPPSAISTNAPPSIISRSVSRETLKPNDEVSAHGSAAAIPAPPSISAAAISARRFTKSEEEYLAALRAWVEEKQYVSLGDHTQLSGFYGTKTMDMYASQPGPGLRRKRRARSDAAVRAPPALDINGRKKSMPMPMPMPVPIREEAVEEGSSVEQGARRKSLRKWLSRS